MPSSMIRGFNDADQYSTSVRATKAEVIVTGRGRFVAKLTRIDLHDLWMQRFVEELPRIAHSSPLTDRTGIVFRTAPGPEMRWSGIEMLGSNIIRIGKAADAFQHTTGAASFAAMTLPIDVFQNAAEALIGHDLPASSHDVCMTPAPAAMARLQRLHAEAGAMAEGDPHGLAHPGTARALEQALVETMVASLSVPDATEDSSARRRHQIIMRRFRQVVQEHPLEALYLPELCAAVGVPHRTLHLCCSESLGIGPKRYLVLRRLNLAKRALRAADSTRTTITEIAASFGFWNFGRFSVEYRSLFGESPSVTLRRPRD